MELVTKLDLFITEQYKYKNDNEHISVLIDPIQNTVLIHTPFLKTELPFDGCHLDYRTLDFHSGNGVSISAFLPIECAIHLNELKAKYVIKKDKRRFNL
jgi:hypothetical protein